jgi:hypothetical protein
MSRERDAQPAGICRERRRLAIAGQWMNDHNGVPLEALDGNCPSEIARRAGVAIPARNRQQAFGGDAAIGGFDALPHRPRDRGVYHSGGWGA